MTKEEITICKMYLNDLDRTHDCNEYKLLMQLLEQESCEDCVSREELKKWLDMNFSFGGALRKLELFNRLDKELPSVIPKGVTVTDFADKCRECGKMKNGKWIPVSERLPENGELVLFSTKTGRIFEGGFYDDKTDLQWYAFRNREFVYNNVVTAWQPLPEPYQEEKE